MNYLRVLHAVSSHPWAILRSKLEAIAALLEMKAQGGGVSPELLAQLRAQHDQLEARAKTATAGAGSVAVLPMYGVISHRANLFSDFSGGTSTEAFLRDFRTAMADPSVSAVVIDVDSPGGSVDGVPELADEIYRARGGKKKITAVANCLTASAAYWLASQADELVCSPSGEVGSIGVYQLHMDESEADKMMGVHYTLIAAGKYKVEANPFQPLSEEALANLQQECNDYYSMFTAAVARGRKTSVDSVRNGFGEGRCLTAKAALKLGMVDRIATLDEVLGEHGVSRATGTLRGQAQAVCSCTGDEPDRECPQHGARREAQVLAPAKTQAAGKPQSDNGNGCACACDACQDDNCADCSNQDCNDPDCVGCPQQQGENAKALASPVKAGNACACPCVACSGGVEGCHACTNADCDDGNCGECPQQREDNAGDDTAKQLSVASGQWPDAETAPWDYEVERARLARELQIASA